MADTAAMHGGGAAADGAARLALCTNHSCNVACVLLPTVAQVRCIAAVLLMVGRGEEAPGIVRQLLDVDAMPAKPYYNMAPEVCNLSHRSINMQMV